MKLCKDCVYMKIEWPYLNIKVCSHPTSILIGEVDPVTGKKEKDMKPLCKSIRANTEARWCGHKAKFWEGKNK